MSSQPVYVKTPKGIEEVERKAHGLTLKPRQVLIMIDGKRDVTALQGIFPPEMVPGILDELLAGGFIRVLETVVPAPAPGNTLMAMKEAMSFALYEVFGPDADNFTGKVEAAKSAAELDALAVKYEETVAAMGGRKKAQQFAAHLRDAGYTIPVHATSPSQAPGSPKLDLKPLREAMTTALFDAFGPDADAFTGKVDAAASMADLEALASKYAEVVAGMGGRKKAEAFLTRLRAAGIDPSASAASQASGDAAQSAALASSTPRPESDKERLDLARNFMINTTNTFVGVVGAPLIVEMHKANNLRELRALYYDWREALQITATGKARLPELEKRLAALLS